LEANDQPHVDCRQQDRQRAIDQRAIDEDIDVPQAIAKDRCPDADGNRQKKERGHGSIQELQRGVRRIERSDQPTEPTIGNIKVNASRRADLSNPGAGFSYPQPYEIVGAQSPSTLVLSQRPPSSERENRTRHQCQFQ
jgi:hypothetical protein